MHNLQLVNCDTDSISVNKYDGSSFTEEESNNLLIELNSIFPEGIVWDDDGYYHTIVVVRAKNYILYDGKKIKIKGSALKASTKEPALKEFIKEIIDSIINEIYNYEEIYDRYVREIMDIKDIKRWVTRKTITEKVLTSERTNEEKVRDAIEDSEYVEGDRAYFYFKLDGSLSLMENFDGEYNRVKLLEKLFKTAQIFNTIIPKETFPNYKLKKNQERLNEKINNL